MTTFNYRTWDKAELQAWQKSLADRMFADYANGGIPSNNLVEEYNAAVKELNVRLFGYMGASAEKYEKDTEQENYQTMDTQALKKIVQTLEAKFFQGVPGGHKKGLHVAWRAAKIELAKRPYATWA